MSDTAFATTIALFGQAGSTWGTTDNGQDWSGDTETYWTRGNDLLGNGPYGKLAVSSSTFPTYDTAVINDYPGGAAGADVCEVLTLVKWGSQASPTNPDTDGGPMINRDASNNFYFVRILDKTNQIAIAAYSHGELIELERVSRTLTPDTWYWIRFQHSVSGILKLKMWAESASEPSSWNIQTYGLDSWYNPPDIGKWGWCGKRSNDNHTWYLRAFYAYTLSGEEEVLTSPSTDNFTRDVREGWGVNAQKQAWAGNVANDPNLSLHTGVIVAANTYGTITTADDVERFATLGPARSGDSETLVRMHFNSTAGTTFAYVGLRGAWDIVARAFRNTGYAVKVVSGGTTLTLWKRTSLGGAWTSITATPTAHTALNSTDTYWVRLQIIGTTLRARIWRQGDAEPGTWNVSATDASISSAGRGYVIVGQDTGITATRTVRFYSYTSGAPTYAGTNHTTIGALTMTARTDSQITLRQAFTNDSNANNSLVVQYRNFGVSSGWTTFGGTITRTSSYFEFTVTGLTGGTIYEFRTTPSDVDGVGGTFPVEANFSTTLNAILTNRIEVPVTGPTSLDVEAYYTEDPNDNSTATLSYRVSGANINIVSDSMAGAQGTFLENHVPEVGGQWEEHPLSSGSKAKLYQGRLYAETLVGDEKVLYYSDTTPLSVDYDVKGQFFAAGFFFEVGLTARMNTGNGNYYLVKYSPFLSEWQLIRANNGGADTLLDTFPMGLEQGHAYDIILRVRDAYKAVFLDGEEILRSTDNTHTSAGRGGVYFKSPPATPPEGEFIPAEEYEIAGTPTNQLLLDDFQVDYRVTGGSFTVGTLMTADRPNKKFTQTVGSLTADTVYEIRVTFTDSDSVNGMNPLYYTVSTNGRTAQFEGIIVSPQPTSAIIELDYLYDTNNNSAMTVQYRSTASTLWTTVPTSKINVDRGLKKFFTTLVGLKPSTTYEVKGVLSDPNGLVDGSRSSITELFTTNILAFEQRLQTKHFLYKTYTPQGEYITTWHDAPTPEYAWHENGGISDLRITLNRPLSSLQDKDSGIDFQNRVDIWTVDPSSDGFGPNLLLDSDFSLDSWTLGANAVISSEGGPDDSKALRIDSLSDATVRVTRSNFIRLWRENEFDHSPHIVPFVLKAVAKARGAKLKMYLQAYDIDEESLDISDDFAETVGTDWQTLRMEYTPPPDSYYLRICFENVGEVFAYADKVELRPKEDLVYRGRIESFTPKIDQNGETIEVEVLGLVSLLSDDYIDFLQFVQTQPERDASQGRPNHGKKDPSEMLKMVIDKARKQNPLCVLYYDDTSIQPTNIHQGFTFREQQVRACFDKIRNLCPSGWHYFIEADGRVVLRGPESAPIHKLRVGVEVMNFSVERSIRNMKNYIHVKGRQDDDGSELDGEGSVHYIAFDQESIDKYGKRMLFIRDAQITDKETAQTVGDGRLEELNKEEQRAQCLVPDDKSISYTSGALRGYNIEAFRPGDNVVLFDPVAGPRNTYWDQFTWDDQSWDVHYVYAPLPEMVPIKTIQVSDTEVRLELSERQPSGTGDFGRLLRWLQLNDSDNA